DRGSAAAAGRAVASGRRGWYNRVDLLNHPARRPAMHRFLARPSAAGALPSRRDWLRIGVPAVLAAAARPGQARPLARGKSVLVVFTSGGQSQLDTWDPKPDAPEEIRGAFRTIPSALPGLRVCEHLPRLAR